MNAITGMPEEMLERVQAIVERQVPGVVCELQDYKTKIGCGALSEGGNLYDAQWSLRNLTEWHVEEKARALASQLAPRGSLIRRG